MTNKKTYEKNSTCCNECQAVAMTSMPYAVLASDFTDSGVLTDSTDFSVSEEFAAEDAAGRIYHRRCQDAFAQKHSRAKLMCL